MDDGSTDGTVAVAKEHERRGLLVPREPGPAGAIAAGYGYAAEHGYEYCGRVDADGQHPVPELRNLLGLVRAGDCELRSARVS